MSRSRRIIAILVFAAATATGGAEPQPRPIEVLVDRLAERLRTTLSDSDLVRLDAASVVAALTDDERRAFSTEYLSFGVNVPVTVSLAIDATQAAPPFWVRGAGFEPTGMEIGAGRRRFVVWQKRVQAGRIELGVQGFDDRKQPYFVVLVPQDSTETIVVTDLYPKRHNVATCRLGERFYADIGSEALDEIPDELMGGTLVRTICLTIKITRLARRFRLAEHPATRAPEQIVLTMSEDPRTTQTVQWRTSTAIVDGVVEYRDVTAPDSAPWVSVRAGVAELEDRLLLNDPVNHRHTAVLRGLRPGTRYEYRVGSLADGQRSQPARFRTAPDSGAFSFMYMGDVQHGFEEWGHLLARAFERNPDAAFCLIAGDLVNMGTQRDSWDRFFAGAGDVFRWRPVLPVIGNHEGQGNRGPWMYTRLFALPENGSVYIPPEESYSVRYGDALIVALNSSQRPAEQAEWLDHLLSDTDATWKIVSFHHPPYPSRANRHHERIRQVWGEVFDRHHVDLVLSGHDHAYMRTYPMHGGSRVASPADGTIYIVSNSGEKYNDQIDADYIDVGMTRLSLYQVLTVDAGGNRLVWRAYDGDGDVKDEFAIGK